MVPVHSLHTLASADAFAAVYGCPFAKHMYSSQYSHLLFSFAMDPTQHCHVHMMQFYLEDQVLEVCTMLRSAQIYHTCAPIYSLADLLMFQYIKIQL